MTRTADRIIADGVSIEIYRKRFAHKPEVITELAINALMNVDLVKDGPILVADNVERYMRSTKPMALVDFPSLAPPWSSCFIEYPVGEHRRGVLIRDSTKWDGTKVTFGASKRNAHTLARENAGNESVRWLLDLELMVEGRRRQVHGPIAWATLALNDRGRVVGNCFTAGLAAEREQGQGWRGTLDPTCRVSPNMTVSTDDTGAALDWHYWMLAALLPALQTIAFLHCRNVVVDDIRPDPKSSKKRQRKTGHGLLTYKTVRLEVPRKVHSAGLTRTEGDESSVSLHIAAGHFAHYGDCCPGVHEPHGKAFGTHSGVYWIADHIRGSTSVGTVRRDLEIVVDG